MSEKMEIKKLNGNTFDVFWGIGWGNCARLQIGRRGYWKIIKGQHLPREIYNSFKKEVLK